MKYRNASYLLTIFLVGFLLAARASAQTVGYRQTTLASSLPNVANNVTPGLANPWGIAFFPGEPFFIADNQAGRVTTLDATGLSARPGSFTVPNAAGTGFDHPTGIVADQNSSFGNPTAIKPFIIVTEQGTIFTWGPNARGDLPQAATLVRNDASSGSVYKGVAILNSSLTAPALAVTDFHSGFIETFLPGFTPVALQGSFTDPDLPAGYAPFGMQVIGRQVFVTYAPQNTQKHDPVVGAGNGIVNIFDMDGNFVKRFATGGALNAPWGIAQASANFGPFSNDILIGNSGDGTINAFDPASGRFVGPLLDGNGLAIAAVGLNALAFRADGFGDKDTLHFTSQVNSADNGIFGAISPGLVSAIRLFLPNTTVDTTVTISANVSAGAGNTGDPTGSIAFLDGTTPLGTAPLNNGSAAIDASFADSGVHAITAQYSGDRVFLPVSETIPLKVDGLSTTVTLAAPTSAAPGSTITLTANINSPSGLPTGQVEFLDGNTNLGSSALNGAGVAILRINTLSAGTHTLTASYDGDGKFGTSTSARVTINIASADFSLGAAPPTATVIAGQSTQFLLTVTPAGGFEDNVTFSCSPVTGVSCVFNPATVTPTNAAATTTLTVTTSASVTRYGLLVFGIGGPGAFLAATAFLSLLFWKGKNLPNTRFSWLATTAAAAIVTLGLAIGGCGGYNGTQPNRGTASILVTARSGTISHTTTVSVTVQ